jgi:hypothetical protein
VTPFITIVIFYYMAIRINLTAEGRFGQLFSHFRFFFFASPVHLAIIAALRGGYNLVRHYIRSLICHLLF